MGSRPGSCQHRRERPASPPWPTLWPRKQTIHGSRDAARFLLIARPRAVPRDSRGDLQHAKFTSTRDPLDARHRAGHWPRRWLRGRGVGRRLLGHANLPGFAFRKHHHHRHPQRRRHVHDDLPWHTIRFRIACSLRKRFLRKRCPHQQPISTVSLCRHH